MPTGQATAPDTAPAPPPRLNYQPGFVPDQPDPPPASPRLLDRIRNFFKPRQPERKDPIAPAVSTMQNRTPATTPMPGATTVTAMRPNLELSKAEAEKVGHEENYAWITGKLFRVSADGGRWVLRYGAPYEVDRYEGAVVLAPGPQLAKCHEGDLVCVHGKVSAVAHGGTPHALYQVTELNVIEAARKP
jgi:hypothetical protein